MGTLADDLAAEFPELKTSRHRETSPPTPEYNCLAWAANETRRRWEPDPFDMFYWPSSATREMTVPALNQAYEAIGYAACDNGEIEAGYEKIAIYAAPDGTATHAARQLPNGEWTSKLGNLQDIEHELHALDGPGYGHVIGYMKRPTAQRK